MAVQAGDVLRDRFRIDALIGRGGMGQVFAATDLTSGASVALKVVSRLLVDGVMMVRLQREAEAVQRIRSAFIPQVFEVNETEDGETFLVMERLVGEPLSQRLLGGALPWSEVSAIGEDILCGLIDAHAAGVVHRDLKPSNVFLALRNSRMRAMVLDFGVCKLEGVDSARLTGTGESIGTVAYMAPEQIRGAARVDERADLFAFGVLVFELLSHRLPHDGPSQMAILASKLENPAARLRDCARVPIPEALDELVGRALERDPAARFSSARMLLEAWRALPTESGATSIRPSLPREDDGSNVGRVSELPTEVGTTPARHLSPRSGAPSRRGIDAPPSTFHSDRPPSTAQGEDLLPYKEERFSTQISLTSRPPRGRTGERRHTVLLVACALVVGGLVAVAGVTFTYAPAPTAVVSSVSDDERSTSATTDSSASMSVTSFPSAPSSSESLAVLPLPSVSAEAPKTPPRPKAVRTRARPSPAPKSSAPRITVQPRY